MKLSLDERLSQAEERRQSYLESVRLKASTATKRKERVDQFQALQYLGEHERLARCNSRLSCASERKKERERERAAAAGRHYQMVIDRVEEMKERGRVEAAEKRERCNERLKEAARRRAEREREGMERSGSESPERPRYGDPAHATDASPAAASSPAPAALPAPANPPGRGHETKSSPPPMTYNRAVEILRACGIHSSAPRAPSVVSPPSGNAVPMPPPMNHPSVAIPFDRFAELIADREVLVATQRILRELLDTSEQKIAVNTRVFLSAYMIVNYPDVVLSGHASGLAPASDVTQEARLREAAVRMIARFEDAVFVVGEGDVEEKAGVADVDEAVIAVAEESSPQHRHQFISSYLIYLDQFNSWKSHDAAGLENDLIKAAVELESSRLVKLVELSERVGSIGVRHQVDIDAMVEGVDHDLGLIEERVESLTGSQGVARLKAALEAVKAAHHHHQMAQGEMDPIVSGSPQPSSSPLKSSPLRKMSRREMIEAPTSSNTTPSSAGNNATPNGSSSANAFSGNQRLSLMWSLLYDAKWRLPTRVLELVSEEVLSGVVDDGSAALSALSDDERRSLVAERRAWGELRASLTGEDGSQEERVFVVIKVLVEVMSRLQEHAGQALGGACERRMVEIQESLLPKRNDTFWMNVPAFLDAIHWCSAVVSQLCAPVRDADIRRAQAVISQRLGLTDDASASTAAWVCQSPHSLIDVIAQSLHVLELQARILNIDVANAHLEALTHVSPGTEGSSWRIQYVREKLAEELGMGTADADSDELMFASVGLTEPVGSLGNTRGWIAVASGRLPRIEAALGSSIAHPVSATSPPSPSSPFPVRMRTGTIGESTAFSSPQTPQLEPISSMRCWRGLVRVGLVHLISGDGAIASMSVPETLLRDVPRLFALQNDFQKCMVLAVCLTVIDGPYHAASLTPTATMAPATSTPVLAASRRRDAARRIKAILGGPHVTIEHIAAEVSSCMTSHDEGSGSGSRGNNAEADTAHVLGTLRARLHRSSCRVLVEHLTNMLVCLLVSYDTSFVHETCANIGASDVADDVIDLGRKIGQVAAVSETVCGPWYAAIASEFAT